MNAGLRPTCFVIAKTSSPSRAASAAIRRAFSSTASRSITYAGAGSCPAWCSATTASTKAGFRVRSAVRNNGGYEMTPSAASPPNPLVAPSSASRFAVAMYAVTPNPATTHSSAPMPPQLNG